MVSVPLRVSAEKKMLRESMLELKEWVWFPAVSHTTCPGTTATATCLWNHIKGERRWPQVSSHRHLTTLCGPGACRDMCVWGDFKERYYVLFPHSSCAQAGALSACVTHLHWKTGRLRRILETVWWSISQGVLCDPTVKSLKMGPESCFSWPTSQGIFKHLS